MVHGEVRVGLSDKVYFSKDSIEVRSSTTWNLGRENSEQEGLIIHVSQSKYIPGVFKR